MLRITPRQLASFEEQSQSLFVARVERFLRAHFPDLAGVSSAALQSEIQIRRQRAEGYGLRTEQEIVSFVIASKALGGGFDERADVGDLLREDRPSSEKAFFLDALVLIAGQ